MQILYFLSNFLDHCNFVKIQEELPCSPFFGKNKKLDHREASAAILMSKSCEKAKNRTTLTFRMVETSFIFTVVRHPFARLVSAYRYSSLGRSYSCGAPPFRQAGIRLQVQYCSLGQSYICGAPPFHQAGIRLQVQ